MVKFKPIGRKNPQDLAAPEKFYAHAISDGFVDLKRLAHFASKQSTVSRADCMAVLIALQDTVIEELRDGRIVQLGELGNFQVGLRSKGSDTPEEVTPLNIKSAHINFRPGSYFREMLETVKFKVEQG